MSEGQQRIGAHVDQVDPVGEALARGADVVQIFAGDPQKWSKPAVRFNDGPAALKAAAAAADLQIFVHSPYIINVASTNNRVRIPSRKLLQQTVDAAADIGAAGVIVHGGHVTADDDPAVGFDNWRKAFASLDMKVPVLIENTAGGDYAMARRLDAIDKLWHALDGYDVGFCLDTCHAWAGGLDMLDVVDRVKAITGRIDLVHANGSRDEADSGRDRHANLDAGHLSGDLVAAVVRAAGAPAVCETPGDAAAHTRDIAFLRGTA
jgi:deoxyribonuclease-4